MFPRSVAVFASGNGSNAENLIRYFANHPSVNIDLLVCNKADAPVVDKARSLFVPVIITDNAGFEEGNELTLQLREKGIEWIVLAGFLRKIPMQLIEAFENRIINIHPALLPKFGGKGMYGRFVHEAVVASGEKQSGITIHLVNGEFDKGEILGQYSIDILPEDTAETVAMKVQELEHLHFPAEVERILTD